MDASEAIRRNTRCQLCGSRFTPTQWDVRHSDDDGADIHDTCCELDGPCSRPPAPDGGTSDMNTCKHCGHPIESDDGTWFHPDTMSARCDGPDDEPGIAWGDLVRQAEPA